jgi:hypothetical protein
VHEPTREAIEGPAEPEVDPEADPEAAPVEPTLVQPEQGGFETDQQLDLPFDQEDDK